MNAGLFGLCMRVVGCALALQFPSTAIAGNKVTVLYSFGRAHDAANPEASPILVNGTMYGTAFAGGTNAAAGWGALYAFDPKTGTETVIYSFCIQQNCADGDRPAAGMIDVKGTLYGTALHGGVGGLSTCSQGYDGCGVVFSLDVATGTERTLYAFCNQPNCADGANPAGGLIEVKGTLYGTTEYGGGSGTGHTGGTVFALDPTTGAETVVYSFCSRKNCADGSEPSAGLIDVNGTLYGTTSSGGTGNNGGTVFALDPNTGAETVIYSFCSQTKTCKDRINPAAGLINVNGMLYGTTENGGANQRGTVFALDLNSGAETVVHTFCSQLKHGNICQDGAFPRAGLIDVNGSLYGTTEYGGTYDDGTMFKLDPAAGTETVLHSFGNGTDGKLPMAGLTYVKGTLYGTTVMGGTGFHQGILFAAKP